MSRIGRQPIAIPSGTEVSVSGTIVSVKGPKGELKREVHPVISVNISDNEVLVTPSKDTKDSQALWGTFASHISNMVAGVNIPFEKKLIIEGVGFKSEVKENDLIMQLGFSHPVEVAIPEGLSVTAEKNVITVSGIDKELVGGFASRVRLKKKTEPYKGKGIRYEGEIVRRKQGKRAV